MGRKSELIQNPLKLSNRDFVWTSANKINVIVAGIRSRANISTFSKEPGLDRSE